MTGRREAAEQAGRRAEALAAWLLRAKGYRVVERRYRTRAGEVDLIVRRGRQTAFVEVKARADREAALRALSPKGRERIERAATAWQARRLGSLDRPVRFDLVTVVGWRAVHHPDHWRPDLPRPGPAR